MPEISYWRVGGFIVLVIAAYFLVDSFLGGLHVTWQLLAFFTILSGIIGGFIATSGIND